MLGATAAEQLDIRKITNGAYSAQGVGEGYALNILDGTVYIQYYDKVVCCPLKDILDGNTVWEEVFRFEGREVY